MTETNLEIKFTKTIKGILGNYFIVKDISADLSQGTDFLVLQIKPFRIACRLRRYTYYRLYADEFTIRWKNPNGYKTEYQKIMDGFVDFLFYGFLNEEETKIISYFIGDLRIFRGCDVNKYPRIQKNKSPDYNEFACYTKSIFPKEFILIEYPKTTNNDDKVIELNHHLYSQPELQLAGG